MAIRPIRNSADLDAALALVDNLWGSSPGTPEGDDLDVLITLIEAYEAKHHRIPAGDPIEVIQYKMRELKLSQNALARRLGWSSGRVSEVLTRKRALTLAMVRALSDALAIPAGVLVGAEVPDPTGTVLVALPASLCERLRAQLNMNSEQLEGAVINIIEQSLSPARAAARPSKRAVGLPPADEHVCLRPGRINSLHGRMAA